MYFTRSRIASWLHSSNRDCTSNICDVIPSKATVARAFFGGVDKNVLVQLNELTAFLMIGGMGGCAWGLYSLVHGK